MIKLVASESTCRLLVSYVIVHIFTTELKTEVAEERHISLSFYLRQSQRISDQDVQVNKTYRNSGGGLMTFPLKEINPGLARHPRAIKLPLGLHEHIWNQFFPHRFIDLNK